MFLIETDNMVEGGWRKRVTKRVAVEVNLTADDWELFTATMDCAAAAEALNQAASKALSCGDPARAAAIFEQVQDEWAGHGAADSEPRYMFRRLMRETYGPGVRC